jgi:hypothetical protein
MGKTAVILLKPPAAPSPLVVRFFIPDPAPAREVRIAVNNRVIAAQDCPGPGTFTVMSLPNKPEGDSATIMISVDKTFSSQSDKRELGIILTDVGFQNP